MIIAWFWQASFWTDWRGWFNAVIFVLVAWGAIALVKKVRRQ